MENSLELNELANSLSIAQGQIDDASKDTKNPFFKSKYADLAAVRAVIRKPLSDNGLSIVQLPSSSDLGISVRTMLMHKSGQYISEVLEIPVGKKDAQSYGSAISYARRYALMSILNIAAEDDDGNAAVANAPDQKPKPADEDKKLQDELWEEGTVVSRKGYAALTEWWKALPSNERKLLTNEQIAKLKEMSNEVSE